MRREFLKTVARGAAAMFVAGDGIARMGQVNKSNIDAWANAKLGGGIAAAEPHSYPKDIQIPPGVQELWREHDQIESRKWRMRSAYRDPDTDLMTLGSVTPAWRAVRTVQRNEERENLLSALKRKIEALMTNPIERVGQEIKKAVLG